MNILILYGPNINLFGLWSSKNKQNLTLDKINRNIKSYSKNKEIQLKILQTNSESKAISYLQKNRKKIAKINSKDYGRLSIISNWRLNVKKEFDISPKCFLPKPKVDSTLLSFVPKKDFFHLKKSTSLEKITRIFFNQRRKMIKNPLRQIFKDPGKIAEKLKLNINLRPQNLSPTNYFNIAREFEDLND